MNRFTQWFAGVIAQHFILQILAAFPAAYLLGLVVTTKQKGAVMFDAVPSVSWPILATLVFIVTVYHGCVLPIYKKRREERKKELETYRREVESAYEWVSQVYKPEILNPERPGNPDAIKKLAQDAVDILRPKLLEKHKRTDTPQRIDVDDEHSLKQWYDYLREERARTHQL